MAYELKQELKLTQSLVMTPQLQLAIKLLQLSRLELVETVKQELEKNPVLEDTVEADTDQIQEEAKPEVTQPEVDWQSYLEGSGDYSSPRINFNERTEDTDPIGNISSSEGGLNEYLIWQLKMQGLPEEDRALGEFIIGNIDENGYLRILERDGVDDDGYEEAVVGEISRCTGTEAEKIAAVLANIQNFDPSGVGSRTLRECLLIQARLLPVRDTVVEEIISAHLEDLAKRDYRAIARRLDVSSEEVLDAARVIHRNLNPSPGAGYGKEAARQIIPDAFVHKVGDDYVITINDDGLPRLRVNQYYRNLLATHGEVGDQAKAYLQDKLRSAMWLIKSVHQRQRTIYRVVECIVKMQRDFLDRGLRYLKPMVLKDVAEVLEVHESTVSRVTSNKYVQTPRGLFELKYFFSGAIAKTDGSNVTAEYIKEKMRGLIESEDSKNPLSDQEIVRLLKDSGINLARRTATKYREALGYLSSNRRKERF